ncbi:ribonuclease H-like domain-containing protein [Tanacetum coccineum]
MTASLSVFSYRSVSKQTTCPSVNAASPQVCTVNVSDNTVYAFMVENPNGSNVLHQDLEQIHEDDLEVIDLKWQLSLLSVKAKKYYQRTGKKIFINANDIAGYDKSKVECYNFHKLGNFAREKQGNNEDTSSKETLAIDGVGFDWSDMAEEQVQTNMALMAFSDSEDMTNTGLDEFKEPKFKGYGPKNSKQESNVVCEKESDNSKENSDESLVEEQVSQDKSSFVESLPNVDKETVFLVNKKINCHNHQRRGIVSRNNYNRVDAKNTHPSVLRNMSPKAVLLKTGLTSLNIVRPVNTAHPKIAVHSAKSKTHFPKQAQSTAKRTFYKQTSLTRRSVHEAKRHYYTGRHNAVNTARSYTGQVNVVRVKGVNVVKSSVHWVWRPTKSNGKQQLDDKGFVDSGCSRHMTGNIAYLSDFKEFDGGYVAFGGGAYGGRITEKKVNKREYKSSRTSSAKMDVAGIGGRKTLTKATRTMLVDSKLPTTFWAEAVSTACYVQNKVLVVKPHNKTPYELFRGFKPDLSFMRLLVCHVIFLILWTV